MQKIKHLFLDLEDTITTPNIDGWDSVDIINTDKIKSVIDSFDPDYVSIFSFALHDSHQLKLFNKSVRLPIENAIDRQLSLIFTVDTDIIPICCEVKMLHPQKVSFDDISSFWSKHDSFRLMMRGLYSKTYAKWKKETEVILLDDAVFNEEFNWPDIKVSGKILNIDDL